jgi:16S rRNA (uracil1498-N3)-methyltransferase
MIRLLHAGAASGPLTVDGAAAHYLFHVHRLKKGDALEVFDGSGRAFSARVVDERTLELGEGRQAPRVRAVTLVQGMPKGDKLELVVQKACELWATALWPAFCERSVVKSAEGDVKKQLRWQKIADEAARQCGRSALMAVERPGPLAEVLRKQSGAALLVLDEAEHGRSLSAAVKSLPAPAPLALFIGPEGGFSDAERALLDGAGAVRVTLGALVLRTETAALAALTVIRHLDGLLG